MLAVAEVAGTLLDDLVAEAFVEALGGERDAEHRLGDARCPGALFQSSHQCLDEARALTVGMHEDGEYLAVEQAAGGDQVTVRFDDQHRRLHRLQQHTGGVSLGRDPAKSRVIRP